MLSTVRVSVGQLYVSKEYTHEEYKTTTND